MDSKESVMQRYLYIFIAALVLHCGFWTFAPPFFLHNYQLDTMEMLVIGQHWVLATFKHPAFQSWIINICSHIFGNAAFVPYLAAQTACALCVITVWSFSRKILPPKLALLAALTLLSYFYFHYDSTVYNNRTFMRFFWILTVYLFYLALQENKFRWWFLTGTALAAGLYCNFATFVLVFTIVLYLFLDPQSRKYWKTPGPYISTAVCLLLFLPLIIWLFQTNFAMLDYAENSIGTTRIALFDNILSPLDFLINQLPIVAVMLIPLYPLLGLQYKFDRTKLSESTGRFLLGMFLLPLFLQLAFASYFAGDMRTALGCQLWLMFPLLLLYFLQNSELNIQRFPVCIKLVFINIAVFAVLSVLTVQLSPILTGKGSRPHFTGKELAEEVNKIWQERYQTPLSFVRGETVLTEAVSVYNLPHPVVFSKVWSSEEQFQKEGGILLWFCPASTKRSFQWDCFGDDDFEYDPQTQTPVRWLEKFPDAEILPPITLNLKTIVPVPPLEIGIAVVPPKNKQAASP